MNSAIKIEDLFVFNVNENTDNSKIQEKNLMIIEDDVIARDLIEHFAKNKDSFDSIKSFDSAEKTLLYINNSTKQYSTILLDNFLPGDEGLSILDSLKEKYPCSKIYLMTGDLNKIDTDKDSLKLLDNFMEKPLTLKQLDDILK